MIEDRQDLSGMAFNMAARLGLVLYRTACTAAVMWVGFVLIVTAALPSPDWAVRTGDAVSCSSGIADAGGAHRALDLEFRGAIHGNFDRRRYSGTTAPNGIGPL